MFQTKPRGLFRLSALGVLVADKPFFFGGGYDFTIHDQSGRGIVSDGTAQPQNNHGATPRSKAARPIQSRWTNENLIEFKLICTSDRG
jgi:hypothetical protein